MCNATGSYTSSLRVVTCSSVGHATLKIRKSLAVCTPACVPGRTSDPRCAEQCNVCIRIAHCMHGGVPLRQHSTAQRGHDPEGCRRAFGPNGASRACAATSVTPLQVCATRLQRWLRSQYASRAGGPCHACGSSSSSPGRVHGRTQRTCARTPHLLAFASTSAASKYSSRAAATRPLLTRRCALFTLR